MTPWKHCLKVTAAALVSIAVVIHTADCKTAGGEPDEPADLKAGVKLRGERVMVTAEVIEGRLRERYLAKRNGAWVEVAMADNDRTFGPVLMVSTEKNAALRERGQGYALRRGVSRGICRRRASRPAQAQLGWGGPLDPRRDAS